MYQNQHLDRFSFFSVLTNTKKKDVSLLPRFMQLRKFFIPLFLCRVMFSTQKQLRKTKKQIRVFFHFGLESHNKVIRDKK